MRDDPPPRVTVPPPRGRRESRGPLRRHLAATLLVAATLAVYLPVLGFDFLNYDDDLYVTANRHVRQGVSLEGLRWALTTTHAANWHPLTWLSHMLDVELFGVRPGPHHAVNLGLHLLAAALLLRVLTAMTGSLPRSAAAAGLFALHPLHVESVAWVAERKDLLSTVLWALALALYLGYVRRPGAARYAAVLACFALALTAKQMPLTLPLLLLLLDWWPLGRLRVCRGASGAGTPGLSPGALLAEKAPLAALSAASAAIAWQAHQQGAAMAMTESHTLAIRSANALVSYARYLGKALVPTRLSVFYPHPAETLPAWQAIAAGALVVAVTLLAVRLASRVPAVLVGWSWYVVTLLPVIGVVQVGSQAMADRYTYVPLTGIFVALLWGLGRPPGRRPVAVAACLLALAAAGAATRAQLAHWSDSCALFGHALRVTSGNAVAHNNLGHCLLGRGRLEEARAHFGLALALNPAYGDAHNNLGVALGRLGLPALAERHVREALRLDAGRADARLNLANVLSQAGRDGEAVRLLREAVTVDPALATAHGNLCVLLARQGRIGEATAECREALRLDPGHELARRSLELLLRGGRP